ncbi:MAG: DUF4007 family protein [Acidimicrobiaceae bacterium]|nr:DUF4007 family protein [Acidimicrobiaceae bacterium]
MRLVDAASPTFARHETFHPRYGWFRKAYKAAADNPYVFTQENAPVELGVGKNMVRAIRYWGLAAKLIVEDPKAPNRRVKGCVPTRIGHAIFDESGWDPYMEDPGTLWLLHWLLLAPQSRLPVWWLAFNEFAAVEFTDDDLETAISTQVGAVSQWASPSPSSLKKDVSALLRTYAPQERARGAAIDDVLNCPLRELNLISNSVDADRRRFTLGTKPTLPPEIATYAVLDWISRTSSGSSTATLSRLTNDAGSPGRAFKLSETELLAFLEPCVEAAEDLALTTATGVVQLAWSENPAVVAPRLLDSYFGVPQTGARAGYDGDDPVDDDLIEDLGYGRDPRSVIRRLHEPAALQLGAA